MHCVKIKFENGKIVDIPASDFELPADLVLIAAGFVHPAKKGLVSELVDMGMELDKRGNVNAKFGDEEDTFKTNLDKVYACGDMRRGQSLVVWAISEGRKCAASVHKALMAEMYEEFAA